MKEALDACTRGLEVDAQNPALKALSTRVEKRRAHLAELDQVRKQREEGEAKRMAILRHALQHRSIPTHKTAASPDMEDAAITLSDPLDAKSALTFPVVLLYPLTAQSDFVKSFVETESLKQHLEYVLPPPWDEKREYRAQSVDCYMETIQGGLIKAGKNLSLLKLLSSGKIEVVDDLVKVNVVPKAKAADWIEEFKRRRSKP